MIKQNILSMKLVNLLNYWPLLVGLLIGAGVGGILGFFGQCSSGICPLTATWWRGAIFGGIIGIVIALGPTGRELRDPAVHPEKPHGENPAAADSLPR
jgi:hypothetical protein